MKSSSCPTAEELADYTIGKLVAARCEQIEVHLPQCDNCLSAVTNAAPNSDTLVAQIRAGAGQGRYLDESQLNDALAQVQRLARDSFEATQGIPHQAARQHRQREQIGPYRFLSKLGEGGMGAVYRALHTKLDRVVALKLLPQSSLQSPAAIARFEREMRMVGKLDHPNIVRASDADEDDGMHYLVMEYVEGLDLAELVRRIGRLPIAEACELTRHAAIGLAHAHEHGMVHRDIKPSNIMLTSKGDVKLLDLGLALLTDSVDPSELTSTGQAMGTLDYMAPEQCDDSHAVDHRADIYSLGATLFKLLTGEAIYAGAGRATPLQKLRAIATEDPPPLESRRSDAPPALAAVVQRMLARKAEDRFASASDVTAALAPFAVGADLLRLAAADAESMQSAAWPQVAAVPPRQIARARWLAVAGAAAAMLLFALLFFLQTPHGTVHIEIHDPRIRVQLTGEDLTLRGVDKQHAIKVRPGEHGLTIQRGDFEFETDTFVLRRGETTRVEIKLLDGHVRVVKDGTHFDQKPLMATREVSPPSGKSSRESPEAAPHESEGHSPGEVFATHGNPVTRVLFTPDGSRLVSASNGDHHEIHGGTRFHVVGTDNSVRVWNVDTGEELHRLFMTEGDRYGVQGLAISRDGALLAASSGWIWANGPSQPRVYVWDLTSGEQKHHFTPIDNHAIRGVAFSPDIAQVRISRSGPGGINSWSLKDERELPTVRIVSFKGEAPRMAWSPDASRLFNGDWQNKGNVVAWNTETGELAQTFAGGSLQATHVAVSPDGTKVAACAPDFSVRVWAMDSAELLTEIDKLDSEALCVAFTAVGRQVIAGDRDGMLSLYDASSGERLTQFSAHRGAVHDLACSTRGVCASAGEDATVRLWTLPRDSDLESR